MSKKTLALMSWAIGTMGGMMAMVMFVTTADSSLKLVAPGGMWGISYTAVKVLTNMGENDKA